MIYESLNVRRIINADERGTWLGGSLMPEPVLRAMAEAARSYVDVFDLQRQVGRRLAQLTHNEAAYVCTGAGAGLVLSTLACMTGTDLKAIARLPRLDGLKSEVIIHRAHRIPYDSAIALAGAQLVDVGTVLQTFPWELEAAITDQTAAVLYIAGDHLARGALALPETVKLAHAHGRPVIVDAAAQLPPPENLWHFTREIGADLAVFSGGKDLRGPQSSGFVVGRSDLIEACVLHGSPYQRLARPMKVGKEEMVGLLTAVELYLAEDHAARRDRFEATVGFWLESFAGRPGVVAERDFPNEAGQPIPRARIRIDPQRAGITATEVRTRLWDESPAIAVGYDDATAIFLTPDTLSPGEEVIVAERLHDVLTKAADQ